MNLRLRRSELGQDSAETQRLLAQRWPRPIASSGRCIAFVEDEIEDREHGRKTRGKLGSAGDLEWNARLSEGPLGPDNALGDGRLRDEKCASDFLGGQASEQAQGERNSCLGRERRMAGREHEAQEIVA